MSGDNEDFKNFRFFGVVGVAFPIAEFMYQKTAEDHPAIAMCETYICSTAIECYLPSQVCKRWAGILQSAECDRQHIEPLKAEISQSEERRARESRLWNSYRWTSGTDNIPQIHGMIQHNINSPIGSIERNLAMCQHGTA
jgi:hypothetical protein